MGEWNFQILKSKIQTLNMSIAYNNSKFKCQLSLDNLKTNQKQ